MASLGNASALTPGATENRIWEKSSAPLETRLAEPLQTLGGHQENEVAGYDYASASLLAAETTTIDAASVRFSQSSISRNFSTGGTIDDLAAGLRNGSINPADIPPIRLVEQDGNLFSLDNRRLWSFQQAEVPVPYRMATPQEAAGEAWKFTTQNGGTSIRVRGQ